MELLAYQDEIAGENLYLVLKNMYYDTGDLDAGAEITREMVVLFD